MPRQVARAITFMALTMALSAVCTTSEAQSGKSGTQTIAPYGSDITVRTQARGIEVETVVAAVGNSKASAQDIKVLSKLRSVNVVDLDEVLTEKQRGLIAKAVDDHRDDVKDLDLALEGNALTFAALSARSVTPAMVVGVDFPRATNTMTIYRLGKGR